MVDFMAQLRLHPGSHDLFIDPAVTNVFITILCLDKIRSPHIKANIAHTLLLLSRPDLLISNVKPEHVALLHDGLRSANHQLLTGLLQLYVDVERTGQPGMDSLWPSIQLVLF